MKGKRKELLELLQEMYNGSMDQARLLLTAPEISSAAFRSFYSEFASVLEEIRQRDERLYDELRQDSEETITKLKVKARAQAIADAQELTVFFASLNSHFKPPYFEPANFQKYEKDRFLPTPQKSQQVSGQNIETKVIGIDAIASRYGLDKTIAERIAPLIGTYVTAKQVSAIAGYSTATFYNKTKNIKAKKDGKSGYLLDETAIQAFFGRTALEPREITPASEQAERWMSVSQIADEYGYATVAPIYARLKQHPDVFPKNDERRGLYLVTPQNSKLLVKQKPRKGGRKSIESTPSDDANTGNPPADSDIVDWDKMVSIARQQFGKDVHERLSSLLQNHGKELQVGQNRFSRKRLEDLLASAE